MEKKILATAISLAMSLEFFCGSTVLADASRYYKLPSVTVQESKEWVPYDDSARSRNDDGDADEAGEGDVVFNPYVFRHDGSASVAVDPEFSEDIGVADRFNAGEANGTYIDIIESITIENVTDKNTTVTNTTGSAISINSTGLGIVVQGDDFTYNGDYICPTIAIYNTSSLGKLTEGQDYTVNYTQNLNAGNAGFTVYGQGLYTGSVNGSFKINPAKFNLNDTILIIECDTNEFTGEALTPNATVFHKDIPLEAGKDFDISFINNTNVGIATVIATGKGNFESSINSTFVVTEASLSNGNTVILGLNETYEYTGESVEPDMTIVHRSENLNRTLESGTDYVIHFDNATQIGNYSFVVNFIGNYYGNATGSYSVVPASLEHDTDISLDPDSESYSGGSLCPTINVTHNGKALINGTDYNIAYFNNTSAGTAQVEVTGKGNYTGSFTQNYTIHPMSIANTTIELGYNTTTYDGSNKTPSVTIGFDQGTLQEGVDYEVTYLNNTNAGQATVNITGLGNFDDYVSVPFVIEPGSLSTNDTSVSINASVDKFQGRPLTVNVTVCSNNMTLEEGKDYDVEYLNNTEAGVATVIVNGKGNFNGTANSTFTIDPQSINSSIVNVTLNETSFTFNGSEVRPDVTVEINGIALEQGKHYTVNYTSNNAPGTGKVIVTGTGSLTGSITKEFEIKEPVKYTVTFEGNGGAGSMDPITVVEGDAFTVPDCGFDAPLGEVFDDWDVAPAGSNMTVTENMTFTAQWKEIIYPVINGSDSWTEGDANLTVEFDAPFNKFLYAECAGQNLTEGVDCFVTEGSTIVTLAEDFLKKLTPGTYTLTAHFTDGIGKWTFKVVSSKGNNGGGSDSPQTSQPMSSAVFAAASVMAVVALGGMAYIAWDEIKKRYNR